jgi:cardiolipin synthase A/B
MRLPPLLDGHCAKLLQGGQEFFPSLVAAIDLSQHEVRLETYIFNVDKSGQGVADALVRAAKRSVAVYLVIDGAGTPNLPLGLVAQLDEAGVQWRIYSRLTGLGWMIPSRWRRLHRKLCVVDGIVAFCGGINILDDFFDPNHGALEAPRFDFAVRVTGPLVHDVAQSMTQFWWRLKAATDVRERDFPAAWAALQSAVRLGLAQDDEVDAQGDRPVPAGEAYARSSGIAPNRTARAALLLRDNLRRRTQIERAYRKAIAEARSEIIIANAYFVPGGRLRRALIYAARRGVRVRLLLQGRYEYFMQYHAARPVFGALLAAGIEIHEYAPSFLHAKVAVIDSRWVTVGSSNLDPVSLLLAREANVVVVDELFAQDLRQRLEMAMQTQGHRMDPQTYARRPLQQRALDMIAFGLMRLMLFLTGNRY